MSQLLRSLNSFLDVVSVMAARFASVALAGACLLVLVEIVLRNIFNMTSTISVEYSIYLLVFLTFMALMHTERTGSMIYMEIVYERFPAPVRAYVNALRYTIALGYGLVATWYVFRFTAQTCSLEQISLYPSRTPLCFPQSVMVIGIGLLTVEWLRNTIIAWRNAVTGTAEQSATTSNIIQKD
jgi:TRAP-type transport system small permease protein